jgi:hypothetical protein
VRQVLWILAVTLVLSAALTQVQAAQVVISWSWKTESKISFWSPDPGKIFIVVTATISVSGYSDFNCHPYYFRLDADSTGYSYHAATVSLNDRLRDEIVPDGATRTGTIVFEIPASVAIRGLRYEASFKSYNIRYQQRGRCLIATAAYGSDLAPDVQLLREFRDDQLLSTFAGSRFMQVFDRFYYSFSPQVAEAVGSNPLAAGLIRVMIFPLIQILKIFMYATATESGLVLAGLGVSAMVGLLYLTLPLSIAYARRNRNAKK